jgi:cyclic pyranopterin phosphate synthase
MQNVSVRFIEEMPFNGLGSHYPTLVWTHKKILDHLRTQYPGIYKIPDEQNSTSANYKIPGHKGEVGIIAAFSRTFCGTCNRLRVTAQGVLKTCLYDEGVLDIKSLMRSGAEDEELKNRLTKAFQSRAANGFEAEGKRTDQQGVHESMSTIGG